ncbi:MAG: adenosylcobinamide amidohydrolase [Halobacteria archaeon]
MFEETRSDGVFRLFNQEARWLSTGWRGGFSEDDAAYNISVPEGWPRVDISEYVESRLDRAGFSEPGPALLTGVDLKHLRAARSGPAVVYATSGVSNPAVLPVNPSGEENHTEGQNGDLKKKEFNRGGHRTGTVNIVVTVDGGLSDGGLTNLLSVAVEAKTSTLLKTTGFPGTTTDAAVVGCTTRDPRENFTSSCTEVGASARACVRDAVKASLESRYLDVDPPDSLEDAEHGVSTTREAEVYRPVRVLESKYGFSET